MNKKRLLEEVKKIVKKEIKEGKLWDKELARLDQEDSFDSKMKMIWMWIKQNKIKKWTELSDAIFYINNKGK